MKKIILTALVAVSFSNFSFASNAIERNYSANGKSIEKISLTEDDEGCYDMFVQSYNIWILLGHTAEEAYLRSSAPLAVCLEVSTPPPATLDPANPNP